MQTKNNRISQLANSGQKPKLRLQQPKEMRRQQVSEDTGGKQTDEKGGKGQHEGEAHESDNGAEEESDVGGGEKRHSWVRKTMKMKKNLIFQRAVRAHKYDAREQTKLKMKKWVEGKMKKNARTNSDKGKNAERKRGENLTNRAVTRTHSKEKPVGEEEGVHVGKRRGKMEKRLKKK